MAVDVTITLPDDLRLLMDEARRGRPIEDWILDACRTHLKLMRDGIVYRKPLEGEELDEAVLMLESRLKGLE